MPPQAWNRPFPIQISDLRGLRYRGISVGGAGKFPKCWNPSRGRLSLVATDLFLEQRFHVMFERETLRGRFYGTMSLLGYLL